MPNPIKANIHIDSALTNISGAYLQHESSFIADKVFPIVPVMKQSDRYFVYLKEDWFRDEARKRVPNTESAGGGYKIDNTPSYYCEPWAYHKSVGPDDRANADNPLDPDRDAVEFVMQKLLIRREVEWVTRFFRTGIWTYNYNGGDGTGGTVKQWSTSGSDPIRNIGNAKVAVQSITGRKPNIMVVGPYVHEALRNHADILDRIKYTERGIVTRELLASLFEVDKYVVAEGVKNSASEGATEDTDFIAGKHCLLVYAPPRPALKQPSGGYIFAWKGLMGAGAFGNRINRIPTPLLGMGTERIEGEMAFDMHLVAADLGIFFNGIVN